MADKSTFAVHGPESINRSVLPPACRLGQLLLDVNQSAGCVHFPLGAPCDNFESIWHEPDYSSVRMACRNSDGQQGDAS